MLEKLKKILFRLFFCKSERKTPKTNSFLFFAFRNLRPYSHFGYPVKVGSYGGILWSHWRHFENKLAVVYLNRLVFMFRQLNKLY